MPVKIHKLEASLRRTSRNHPTRGKREEELAMSYAGFRGEQSLDYFLDHLPHQDHVIFQDLRLPISTNTYFQIDFLLLSL